MRRAHLHIAGRSRHRCWQLGSSALALLLAAAAAGCGGDDGGAEDTDVEPGGSTGVASGTSADPTSAASTTPPGSGGATDDGTQSGTAASTASGDSDSSATETSGEGDTGSDTSGGAVQPPPGLPCEQTFEHNGRQGCQSVVEGVEVKFFPLDQNVPAQRLVVFLHGDGGADYTANWGFRTEILDWAIPQDFLVVGVRSPASYDGDTAPSFGAAQPDDANMVATTLEAFVDAYEVVEDRALYWGISGGSWFTTSSYIPVAGHRVPGIFVANCGGSGVSFGWAWDPATDTTTLDLNALALNYGDQDFLAEPSAESYAEYTALGFTTDQVVHPGATHCNHPISDPTIDFWVSQM